MRRVLPTSVLAIAALALIGVVTLKAQQPKPSEYQVKAAYLYNFSKFVTWPAQAEAAKGDSFAICVIGSDPFGAVLDTTIAGGVIGGKTIVAKRISEPKDAANCRILFVSSSVEKRLPEILRVAGEGSVLTVSDLQDFARRGGMIQFKLDGGKVRFEVDLTPIQKAGLTLSSELLKVAVTVRQSAAVKK